MRAPKIYLETTLFNFYVDEDRGFAHDSTITLFKEIAAGKYEAFTSAVVMEELVKAPSDKFEKMSRLIQEYRITTLSLSDEADRLADIYVAEGIIPPKYHTDGVHVALAAVNDLDMIVSMNFQHIVKRKTVKMTGHINTMNGYRAVEIYSPMEVIESEND
jgi:predicted nucleic acid-binding protein